MGKNISLVGTVMHIKASSGYCGIWTIILMFEHKFIYCSTQNTENTHSCSL